MTTEDKTGDKLVASIRKTKAGATGATETDAPAAPAAPTRKKSVAKKTAADESSVEKPVADGQYLRARRVWPD
jgi:hypothetical protein